VIRRMPLLRALFATATLLVGAMSQLSCSINDYCLGCDNGDGDGGMGSNDGGDGGGGSDDAMIDAGCIPSGPEECDGKDNDCNGLVDDGVIVGVGVLCANQNGACAGGLTVCVNGMLKCDKMGSPEVCNGIDDNCSGTPDEGDPGGGAKCGTDQGECVAGQFRCNPNTGMVECFGFQDHTQDPELCDGRDNDCDGTFDENVVFANPDCGPMTDTGECVIGTLSCMAGTPICTGAVFPKFETCNGLDDDCNGAADEIFNKQTDIQNCGACGTVCQPTSKTCIFTTNTTTSGVPCTMDSQCPGGSCVINSQPRCSTGNCSFQCNAGFKDFDTMPANGCEYRCFVTGLTEECDGIDNDCDGNTDEGLTAPPICLSKAGSECGTNTVATCTGAGGWVCNYPGDVQFPETKCDGKNNDCDANIDEAQPNFGDDCFEVAETACGADTTDDDNDGFTNDGCPVVGTAETGAQCGDAVDSDGDGAVNDGCPAKEERGVCKSKGTYQCDSMNLDGPATCVITMPGMMPAAQETCDAKDNDCDGKTDEGGNMGNLVGQEWVDIGNGHQMMRYEASKPDATDVDQGTAPANDPANTTAYTCSRKDVRPWTNIKYQDAVAACAKIGASLCTEVQWHRACSKIGAQPNTIPAATTGTFIEAEDYLSTTFAGNPESGTACAAGNAADEDGDGRVNDGCPIVGAAAETACTGTTDDDGDGTANDGCPAMGPHSWVEDYTSTFSGIGDMEATPNLGAAVTNSAAAIAASSPALNYSINFANGTNYHVWLKVFANSNVNDSVYVALNNNAALPASTGTYNSWVWIDAGTFGTISGTQTIHLYMAEDGIKVDKIYVFSGSTTAAAIGAAETIASKGGNWAFLANPNTYVAGTCNADDYDTDAALAGDQDDILKTGALPNCAAAWTTPISDLSGNVKEWTLRHAPGENPIRGGASNNTPNGISCPLNFTLADDNFFFPNIGFRCCK